MEDTRVSFKTAKLLKEVGFKEKCTHYYILDFMNFKSNGELKQHLTPIEDNLNILQLVEIGKGQPHLASAPTQSLAQKWIREIHNIHIELFFDVKGWFYVLKTISFKFNHRIKGDNLADQKSKTYEEALEEALKQVCLIIKKQKN